MPTSFLLTWVAKFGFIRKNEQVESLDSEATNKNESINNFASEPMNQNASSGLDLSALFGIQKANNIAINNKKSVFNLEKMEKLAETHILSLVSYKEMANFIWSNEIPNSLFSVSEQKQLKKANRLNTELLRKALSELNEEICVKFVGFETDGGCPKKDILCLLPE